jgi:hypothetical protein
VWGWTTQLPYWHDATGLAFSPTDEAGTFYVRRSFEDPTVVSVLRWSVAPDGETSCEQEDPELLETELRLIDGAGEPVAGVSVLAREAMVQSVRTDEDGRAWFELAAGTEEAVALGWVDDEERVRNLPSTRVRAGEARTVTVDLGEARPYELRAAADLAEALGFAEAQVEALGALLAEPNVPGAIRAHWEEQRTEREMFLMLRSGNLLPDGTRSPAGCPTSRRRPARRGRSSRPSGRRTDGISAGPRIDPVGGLELRGWGCHPPTSIPSGGSISDDGWPSSDLDPVGGSISDDGWPSSDLDPMGGIELRRWVAILRPRSRGGDRSPTMGGHPPTSIPWGGSISDDGWPSSDLDPVGGIDLR